MNSHAWMTTSGTGQFGGRGALAAKLAIVAATMLSALMLDGPAVVAVVVATGWLMLAVHKSLYLRSLAAATADGPEAQVAAPSPATT